MNGTFLMNTVPGLGTISTVKVSEQTSMQYGATSTDDIPQPFFVQYEIVNTLRKVIPIFILLFGTFGNVMTVLVMRTLRNQSGDPSMCVYFPSLAVCDQVVITVGLSRSWIRSVFLYDIRDLHVVVCKLHKFSVFAVGRMSTWILVAVTSQRVMSVVWPLRQRLTSTKKRAKAVVLAIVVSCCLLDVGILVLHTYVKMKSGNTKCKPGKGSVGAVFYEDEVYPWLNIVTGSLLPLSILVINNVILGFKVRQSANASRQMTGTQQADTRTKQTTSLSLTLIVTSITFILLTSPIPVGFFFKTFYLPLMSSDEQVEADTELADAVLDLLWYCNSAVNFYLYFLTGPTFRQQARSVLCSGGMCHSCSSTTSSSGKDSAGY